MYDNNNIKKAPNVPPFLRYCSAIIPTAFDDSLSYYEALCALYKWLQTNVIDTINHNASVTNDFINKEKELEELFEQLKEYVDTYFENLDVQEEINNKLDDMVEDGTLQEIITTYIQANVAWTFDSVADMKLATNLMDGSYAQTYGFYSKGDSGGSKYIIRTKTEADVADEITLIDLADNSLIAELVIEPTMNVKQFGAVGDGETDDTTSLQTALNNVKNIEFVNATYVCDYVTFKSNQTVEGNGATLNCAITGEGLIGVSSHCTIKNITLNCTNHDRPLNRISLNNKSFITFENVTFSGFQQQNVVPPSIGLTVWALYVRECHDIRVINCNFVDNNFQDVIIEYDNENILFENCTGSYNGNDGFVVDIEPSEGSLENRLTNKNIKFTNCDFRDLQLFEYYNEFNQNTAITIDSSLIRMFYYKGGDVTIINSPILSFNYKQAQSFRNGDGNLILDNCLGIGENLIKDPYLKDVAYKTSTGHWLCTYATSAWLTLCARVEDPDGYYLSMNKDNASGKKIAIQSENIKASEGDTFLLKINARSFYPTSGSGQTAHHVNVIFKDSSDNTLLTLNLTTNRGEKNTQQNFSEKSNIIMCPANTDYFYLQILNSNSESSNSTDYRAIGVYKLTCDKNARNSINALGCGNGKTYYAKENPQTNNDKKINHFTGERCEYDTPSTYIGAVCTDGSTPTWKQFGALES